MSDAKANGPPSSRRGRTPLWFTQDGENEAPTLELNSDAWSVLEAAGQPLNDEARAGIQAAVNSYLEWDDFEASASEVPHVIGWLEHVRAAADKFITEFEAGPKGVPIQAQRDGLRALTEHLKMRGKQGALERALSGARDLAAECRASITASAGLKKTFRGDNWEDFVRKLARIFEKHGLSVSTSQQNTTKYVLFVYELQKFLPVAVQRRGLASIGALDKAIANAFNRHADPARGRSRVRKSAASPRGTQRG